MSDEKLTSEEWKCRYERLKEKSARFQGKLEQELARWRAEETEGVNEQINSQDNVGLNAEEKQKDEGSSLMFDNQVAKLQDEITKNREVINKLEEYVSKIMCQLQ